MVRALRLAIRRTFAAQQVASKHVDHLNRPVKLTDTAKAAVWDAIFLPWGGVHTITGSATLDARFPVQWFQLESGLHDNWHRQYDPSIGRYTQPDPLGFVDGPSVYAYVRGGPQILTDRDGRVTQICVVPGLCPAVIRVVVQTCTVAIGTFVASRPTPGTCTKESPLHLNNAGIKDAEKFKEDHLYRPSSRFDICACSDGSIRIGAVGQCGRQNPEDMGEADTSWK